ncbi:MAG: hypothetical protein CH6_2593 [Candidatus Kapaibacterium sp.]|nr:MAG: hypothetical protein CH6_2593 [Candidatus Kapabacteria bacterium]
MASTGRRRLAVAYRALPWQHVNPNGKPKMPKAITLWLPN